VEFECTIPASERAKAGHALDRSATVTGITMIHASHKYTTQTIPSVDTIFP
jgi:hypothetical protein